MITNMWRIVDQVAMTRAINTETRVGEIMAEVVRKSIGSDDLNETTYYCQISYAKVKLVYSEALRCQRYVISGVRNC